MNSVPRWWIELIETPPPEIEAMHRETRGAISVDEFARSLDSLHLQSIREAAIIRDPLHHYTLPFPLFPYSPVLLKT